MIRLGDQVEEWIQEGVGGAAHRVAQVGRPEQRQHDVLAFAEAPDGEGLAEVLVMMLKPQLTGHVKNPQETGKSIDEETHEGFRRPSGFPLQNIVYENQRRADIAEKVARVVLYVLRQNRPVALGERLEHRPVQGEVGIENRPIGGLERIVGFFERRPLFGIFRRRHATAEEQGSQHCTSQTPRPFFGLGWLH